MNATEFYQLLGHVARAGEQLSQASCLTLDEQAVFQQATDDLMTLASRMILRESASVSENCQVLQS